MDVKMSESISGFRTVFFVFPIVPGEKIGDNETRDKNMKIEPNQQVNLDATNAGLINQ